MAIDNFRFLVKDFDSIRRNINSELAKIDTFKDYNFEGSYISTFVRQIAYVGELLTYMLNAAASETHLPIVKLYENANSLSKIFGYNPMGHLAPDRDWETKVEM